MERVSIKSLIFLSQCGPSCWYFTLSIFILCVCVMALSVAKIMFSFQYLCTLNFYWKVKIVWVPARLNTPRLLTGKCWRNWEQCFRTSAFCHVKILLHISLQLNLKKKLLIIMVGQSAATRSVLVHNGVS